MKAFRLCSVVFSLAVVGSCSGSQQSDEKDAATACADLCSGSGFSSSRVDEHSHETNCFCSGGTGTVTADKCTDACKSMGKDNGQVFGQSAGASDACQCS